MEKEEKLVLGASEAKQLAEKYRTTDGTVAQPDPFDCIPPSLLSAEHIKKYVKETGLISPFYTGGGKLSRLKKAAYEGRMGNAAYLYKDDHDPKQVLFPCSSHLTVPANSIVYVECDLEFRLPEFIALRFNLQIQHVHRGLLLGTGPLVDPGFWGKLCIPLHNLTDKPYEIPKDVGLIWVEFTKTTSDISKPGESIGRRPLGTNEFWDITDFLTKASAQFDTSAPAIPLRSSLPEMFDDATKQSQEAERSARSAAKSAEAARIESSTAKDEVQKIRSLGIFATLAAIVGLIGLWLTFFLETIDYKNEVAPLLSSVSDVKGAQGVFQSEFDLLRADYDHQLQRLDKVLQALEDQNLSLRKKVQELEDIHR